MGRVFLVTSSSAAAVGTGLLPPVFAERAESGSFSAPGVLIAMVGGILLAVGLLGLVLALGREKLGAPPPVRAVVIAAWFFIAFCALELSDGLTRQKGRVFYWTTVLFLPALLLHCGLIFRRRRAWQAARVLAAVALLWFAGFLVLIPFVDLRTADGPVPWHGRVYMAALTAAFAAVAGFVYRALAGDDARRYFEMIDSGDSSAVEESAIQLITDR